MERGLTEGAIKAKEQLQDRPPFVIRAHHLATIEGLLKSGKSVDDFTGTYCRTLERGRERDRASLISLLRWGHRSYVKDVLGSMVEQADKFRRYEKEFYEEFLQLPLDYPVKIAEGQKDKICQGCAIGKHCSGRPSIIWDREDKMYIRAFRKGAKKLNLEDDLTVVDEIATYPNAKPKKVKSILTTSGTIKEVIKSGLSLGYNIIWGQINIRC